MDKIQDVEQRRSLWMATVKTITETCFQREVQVSDLCPQRTPVDQDAKTAALKSIARLSREISGQVQKLKDIERDGGIGFANVMGHTPDELTTVVLCLLVAARLESAAASSLRIVADLMHQTAVRNPVAALQVRGMFRPGSVLSPLVVLGRGVVADECYVSLRESVLNRILAQPSDALEARCEAEALVGKIRLATFGNA